MELKEFIKTALLDVVNGVDEANKVANRFKLSSHIHSNGESGQKIEFDISVVASDSTENNVKGGIAVAVLNIGGSGKVAETNQNTHKIKFEVFVTEK